MSGTLFIVSAPSGAGKTTLVQEAVRRDPDLRLSVSYTTRPPREREENGREYHFVDRDTFVGMRDAGAFVEWAEVHDNFYGTSREWLVGQLEQGLDTLLEIDWQGARQMLAAFPDAVSVFVLPPSLDELERRLRRRKTDSEEVIARRLQAARGEMLHAQEFGYVIINDRLPEAIANLAAIVQAARLRYASQCKRHDLFSSFSVQD